jgi:hypothetical protein
VGHSTGDAAIATSDTILVVAAAAPSTRVLGFKTGKFLLLPKWANFGNFGPGFSCLTGQ